MTSTALEPRLLTGAPTMPVTHRRRTGRVTLARVILSEWIKIRSLRSTVVSLFATFGVVVALGLLFAAVAAGHVGGESIGLGAGGTSDPVSASLGGVQLAQLVIGVIGVLLVAGEYSTGMIRTTLAAVPKRLPVLWGKTIVFGGVTLALMLVGTLAAFFGGQQIMGTHGVSLFDPGVLRAVIGAAVYLTGVGLLGLTLAALLRGTAAAIAALFGAMLVVPGLFPLLPSSWNDTVGPYLPSHAGESFMAVTPSAGMLGPWAGLAVFAGYVVAALAAAAVMLKRRDA
ncbi:ABC-type transport system involved in multi-copper enzyme maturation permease subunit [Micromonospora pisi]|uniref:ABC-type transport system involved in multi-copper enzyme maturation permease subunit n=1 Tax=Micromonospora pisi TaxID=589240 RepID=A0A495JU94_9ACTN|nr:ABC transporter permease subunit [Micromonospora pisi]RKR92105.1 ABC-type transport system involved in multi-copper enzyme maturation permease subunit [Micromonospora pisi]